MLAYIYAAPGKFELVEKPKPALLGEQDAIVRVTLASICTSDLHIKHGSVPRAVPGVTVGHEMVGVVESVGPAVTAVRQVLLAGGLLATGFWAARISDIGPEDIVLVIGAGPTGLCTLGTEKDIKPFIDPRFKNNIILSTRTATGKSSVPRRE